MQGGVASLAALTNGSELEWQLALVWWTSSRSALGKQHWTSPSAKCPRSVRTPQSLFLYMYTVPASFTNSCPVGVRSDCGAVIPSILANMPAGHLSIVHDLRGPNHAVSTACTTGAHAIGDAFTFIREGHADLMLCGATESNVSALGLAGFGRAQALATGFNDEPGAASRPFDAKRCGFIMGEGSGVLVLEELSHALARGAPQIYAEVMGYGLSADAHHITTPAPGGNGAVRAMEGALRHAGLPPAAIDYVNAHATSTPIGDVVECAALQQVFGPSAAEGQELTEWPGASHPSVGASPVVSGSADYSAKLAREQNYRPAGSKVCVSSTKGASGHLLGAAGAMEAIFTVMALHTGQMPPTANLETLDPELVQPSLQHIYPPTNGGDNQENMAQKAPHVAMSNSFGFGGTNASLIFRRWEETEVEELDADSSRKKRIAELLAREREKGDAPTKAEFAAFKDSLD